MKLINSIKAKLVIITLFILVINAICYTQPSKVYQKYFFTKQKMGAPFNLIFFDCDSAHANNLAQEAYLIVDHLNNSFSDYLDTSEISIISKNAGNGQWIPVSDDLLNILLQSKNAYRKSEGAFDITLGQLTKLWRKARKETKLPNNNILKQALETTQMKYFEIDSVSKQVRLIKKGSQIDLGGIGKGYAAEKVLQFLYENNVKSAIVDAAGNMAIGENPLDKNSWQIEIEIPKSDSKYANKVLKMNNLAISTSGDAYQFITIKGKRYSHILDPKTGLGLNYQRQVTIVCKNAAKADWLSTACCIMPINKALTLAKKEGAEIIIFKTKNNKIKEIKSAKFDNFLYK